MNMIDDAYDSLFTVNECDDCVWCYVWWANWLNDEFMLKLGVLGCEHNLESMIKWWIKVLICVKLTCSMWYTVCMMNYVRLCVLGIEIGDLEML